MQLKRYVITINSFYNMYALSFAYTTNTKRRSEIFIKSDKLNRSVGNIWSKIEINFFCWPHNKYRGIKSGRWTNSLI
jgi:hypothetical protein